MKKYQFLLIVIFIFSCSPEGTDSPVDPPVKPGEGNKAPSKPVLIYPTDGLLCTQSTLMFEWDNSTDFEGDPITYHLQIGHNSEFTDIYFTGNASNVTKEVELEKGKIFYWRVSAKDNKGMVSNFSQVRSFYTEGIPNSNILPSLPEVIFPKHEADVESRAITFKWWARDGNGDDLIYDLYFGESNSPQLLKEGLTSPEYSISDLMEGKKYYWKVTVKDNRGGSAHGEVWSFNVK